jgi:hypothetical protein
MEENSANWYFVVTQFSNFKAGLKSLMVLKV